MAVFAVGCLDTVGGEGGPTDAPCERCEPGTEVCWNEEHCVSACDTTDDCERGHACVATSLGGACTPACLPSLCDAARREDCTSPFGQCAPVECSFRYPCERPGEFCATGERQCYRIDGRCSDGVCPEPAEVVAGVSDLVCREQFCRHVPRVPSPPEDLGPGLDAVGVNEPDPGDVLAAGSDPEFQIAPQSEDSALLFLVLSEPTESSDDLLDRALWGASAPPGTRRVRWSGGVDIRGGRWQLRDPLIHVHAGRYSWRSPGMRRHISPEHRRAA